MAWPKKEGQSAKDFQFKVLLELRKEPNEKGDGGTLLCVGQWLVDGSPKTPKLEYRDFWNKEDGSIQAGKAKGMTVNCVEAILRNLPEVARIMGWPAQLVKEALAAGMGEETKTFSEWSGQATAVPGPEAVAAVPEGEPF